MTAKNTTGEDDRRLPTPLVYRDTSCEDRWLVEPPPTQAGCHAESFTGPNARQAALEFAHRTYGCARYLAV